MENSVCDINKVPAITWSWLKINQTSVPSELKLCEIKPENISFNNKVVTAGFCEKSSCVIKSSNGSVFDLEKIEGGIGKNGDFLFGNANPFVIEAKENEKVLEPVVIYYDFSSGNEACLQVIHAKEGSSVNVVIVIKGKKSSPEVYDALRTLCIAESGAVINLKKVQLMEDGRVFIDDTGSKVLENGKVFLSEVFLGGSKTIAGSLCNLDEYLSKFESRTAYLCRENQILDMNYVVRHLGKKTECQMDCNGTVTDSGFKTYRGTIDFKKGCSGAVGHEMEETLLLNPLVKNSSLPIILCDEEDVEGTHGSTIGRLGEDELFYMESRGISKEECEKIMARAKLQSVVDTVEDEGVCKLSNDFMDSLFHEEN